MQDNIIKLPTREPAEPELRSKHNLPAQLTPLIGREQDVAAACTLLRRPDVRLVTLTGTGGVGKTRLALQVATDLLDDFPDGVTFVSLAPISDPDLAIPTIAQTLDVKESGVRPLLDLLKAFLRDQHLLLLLDNFEQILPAAPHLTDLLTSCPHLTILVTSRATLHIQGEHEFPVPSLAVPDLKHLPEPESLRQYAAVALFLQRAQATKPTFQLTMANARTIAEICIRLDGLPLAIELAAACVKLLSPQALLARLGQRLAVLTSGTRDAPTRQQTLRNTIAWSYDLLSAQEQRLFRRLSVFVGGCTLEAVEAVCAARSEGALVVLNGVASLIDKNLVQQEEQANGELRFSMFETLREYGLEALEASGEMEAVRQAHATYYLALVEQAEPELNGPQQAVWREHLEQEYGNLRAAIQWSLKQGKAGDSMEMPLRLGGALSEFWFVRGYRSEGRNFLERALAGSKGAMTPVRAKALETAGELALSLGDRAEAEALCKESLALCQELGDPRGMAHAFYWLGKIAAEKGELSIAHSLFEQAVAIQRETGDKVNVAWSLSALAYLPFDQGEYTEALRDTMGTPLPPVYRADYDQSVASARAQLGEKAFATAWAEGRTMTLEQAFAARGPVTTPAPASSSTSPAKSAPTYPDDLTAREVEVLRLLAQGLTDAQIAGQLVMSKYTASNHVKSILSKLGVTTRSAATRYAVDHMLV